MSFTNRYLITLLSSIIRAGLNFVVSIQIAKYLMPELYGNYQYVLTISTAILLFTNMSTESAFFTFISKKKQHIKFYITYFSWQFLQILLVFLFVLLLNQDIYHLLFKDIDMGLVFIAIGASFFVGNIQNTSNHIAESIRKTHFSQILSIGIAVIHLTVVLSFIYLDSLSVKLLFQVLLFEYVLYTFIIFILLKKHRTELFTDEIFNIKDMIGKFYIYCKPMFILAIFGFIYTFMDRWLIQTYVGAEGQAYFSISMQFSALTILVTSSILKVFWKEMSESIEQNDLEKTKKYFVIVSKNLFVFTCVVSSILFFFSDEILKYFYSDAYMEATLVFKLIMLYPILQSMGQLYSVFLLSTEQTKLYRNIAIGVSILSISVAILFLSDFGMNLGVKGIAIKLLIMNFFSIFMLEYYIMKYLNDNTNYFYKIKFFILIFSLSYLVYLIQIYLNFTFLVQVVLVGIFYVIPIGVYLFNSLKKELKCI